MATRSIAKGRNAFGRPAVERLLTRPSERNQKPKTKTTMTTTNLMEASRQWASRPADQRYQTLTQLRDAVHRRRMVSRSVDLDVRALKAEERNGTIVLNSAISACDRS